MTTLIWPSQKGFCPQHRRKGHSLSWAWSLGITKPPSKFSANISIFIWNNWLFSFAPLFLNFPSWLSWRNRKCRQCWDYWLCVICTGGTFDRRTFSRNRSRMLHLTLCSWHRRRVFWQLGNEGVRPCQALICVSRMCLDWVRRMFWHWAMRMFG